MLEGESLKQVLRNLQSGRHPSSLTNLRRTLANPTYAGLRAHRGEIIGPATWPAIITETQHHQVVELFRRRSYARGFVSPPGPEPRYLLTGIAVCQCGKPLRPRRRPKRDATYECPDGHVIRVMRRLDRLVEEKVFERLSHVDPNQFENEDPRVAEAMREIAEIEATLEEWIVAAAAGDVTPNAFSKIEQGLKKRIDRLRPITLGTPRMHKLPPGVLEGNWPGLSVRERREIVRGLFRVTVNPTGKRWATKFDTDIEPI
jgi:hypothetical protein